jgi:hypothetical protein
MASGFYGSSDHRQPVLAAWLHRLYARFLAPWVTGVQLGSWPIYAGTIAPTIIPKSTRMMIFKLSIRSSSAEGQLRGGFPVSTAAYRPHETRWGVHKDSAIKFIRFRNA